MNRIEQLRRQSPSSPRTDWLPLALAFPWVALAVAYLVDDRHGMAAMHCCFAIAFVAVHFHLRNRRLLRELLVELDALKAQAAPRGDR